MNWPAKLRLQMLCIGRAMQSSWIVCFSFPSTFCPPCSCCCLDLPSIPLSKSSTTSWFFLALMYSWICKGSFSCYSHKPLLLCSGCMFRREIFLGIVILARNFQKPEENLLSSKFISLSERLITCTGMSRIKYATSVFKKSFRINPFSTLCESSINSDVWKRISTTIIH